MDKVGCWMWGHCIPLDNGGPRTSYGHCIHCWKEFSKCEWFVLQLKFRNRGHFVNVKTGCERR